jgi:ERF superfamily
LISQSPELGELATALCAAQAEFTTIPKDSKNPFFRSTYAGLPKVIEVASPVLTKHGLSISQFIGIHESGADMLTTMLMHKSGQFLCDSMLLHLAKQDPQGQGSATTYARRYSYMAALGLVADNDDDGHLASRHTNQGPSTPAESPVPTRAQEDEDKQRAAAIALYKVLAEEHPERAEEFGAWARQRDMHGFNDAHGATLHGALRKLRKLIEEASSVSAEEAADAEQR